MRAKGPKGLCVRVAVFLVLFFSNYKSCCCVCDAAAECGAGHDATGGASAPYLHSTCVEAPMRKLRASA